MICLMRSQAIQVVYLVRRGDIFGIDRRGTGGYDSGSGVVGVVNVVNRRYRRKPAGAGADKSGEQWAVAFSSVMLCAQSMEFRGNAHIFLHAMPSNTCPHSYQSA